MATTDYSNLPDLRERITPPKPTEGYRIDINAPLHQLFVERYYKERDLKVIITSKDSETGTGKTTLAFALADQWHQLFAPGHWQAGKHATLDIYDYLEKYRSLKPGSVLILDEAEELDARRSMASKNVDFSHYWMKMRVRQVTSILTLPSTTALDSRLEELADVWIEVQRRGKAVVHDIRVNSYNKTVQTWKAHEIEWPNVADHPQMKKLHKMKQENIEREINQQQEEEETPDPEEVKKETIIEIAQTARDNGKIAKEIAADIPYGEQWVYKHTEPPDETGEGES